MAKGISNSVSAPHRDGGGVISGKRGELGDDGGAAEFRFGEGGGVKARTGTNTGFIELGIDLPIDASKEVFSNFGVAIYVANVL